MSGVPSRHSEPLVVSRPGHESIGVMGVKVGRVEYDQCLGSLVTLPCQKVWC